MRVLLTPHGRHHESVMVTMAHELQHAWEVPHDSSVTDEDSMRELFKRIGHISVLSEGVTTRETRAARQIEARVLDELRRRSPSARE